MTAPMEKREISADELEIVLEGHLTRDASDRLQLFFDDALKGGHRLIALDFAAVESLSSTAIGKIVRFRVNCSESGRRLVIRRCNPRLRELLHMFRFDELIDFEE
jgi:anti-anti-sigma factor